MTRHLPHLRSINHLASRHWTPILVLMLMVSSCQAAGGVQEIAKDRFRLTIMTLNIANALPEYSSNPEITLAWRDRYTRIADGLKTDNTTPDIIALQEATARKEWVLHADPQDYESIHYLISKIKGTIGIEYRIAYLGAAPSGHPGLIAGEAVLYNPARLKNITKAPSTSALPGDSTPKVLGVHPRKSFPCASPASAFKGLCGLLDGEGIYYTSVWANDKGNQTETGAVRFTFTADDQYGFNFYNVHLHPTNPPEDDKSSAAARNLINFMEGLKYSGNLYPPIVAGDFNGGTERIPNFEELATPKNLPPDADVIDYIIGGRRTSYPSNYGFSIVKTTTLPDPRPNPDHMCAPRNVAWSDHCALVAYLEPAS